MSVYASLTLSNPSSSGNKRQSLPVRPIPRSPIGDRPQSSGIANGSSSSHIKTFTFGNGLQQFAATPNYSSGLARTNVTASNMDTHLRSTPTPGHAHYSSRAARYASAYTPSPLQERDTLDFARAHDMQQFGRRRHSSIVSDAAPPQRKSSHHDLTTGDTTPSYAQETPDLPPLQPAPRRSDPESGSVDSNTAPSTVWDELDDLKSRIKKLELTGKTPSTSAAAVATQVGERPRTATTAPTTISSSPQRVRHTNAALASQTTIGGPAAANAHPLLHSALAKAKPLLSPPLYRALEATASDALTLAAMTGSPGPQGTTYSAASVISGVNVSERQIRRKADSMCRNLTDLCIALCEGKNDLPSPTVRASPATLPRVPLESASLRYVRRSSIENEDRNTRSSPSWAQPRFDGRRSSLLGLGLGGAKSPRDSSEQSPQQEASPSQNHIDYAARYHRPGTSLLRPKRLQSEVESPEESPLRPQSRAMTEIGHIRPRRSIQTTGAQPHSPGLRDTLPIRRQTANILEESIDEQADASPRLGMGLSRASTFYERHAAPISEAGTFPANKRRRRITNLEQYSTPRLGTEPMRTSSLSRRRNVVVE